MSGAWIRAMARLVSGDSEQMVISPGAAARSVSMIKSTPCLSAGFVVGSGRSGPSSPVGPCTCVAVTRDRRMGLGQPANTGISVRSANSRSFRQLRTV